MEASLESPSRGPTHSKVDASNSMKVCSFFSLNPPVRISGEVGGWDDVFFFGGGRGGEVVEWLNDESPNFATRSFVTLKGFLLLGGFLALDGLTSTFQEKLFKDRAIWHGIHLVFLQTSSVDFQTCHLGCLLFNIGFFQYFSYEFRLVSHIQSLFQQLLLDFWDQTIIEGAPHHQVQSDDVHQPFVSWLQKSQQ